ncbi:hypothetical protein TcBrA4_0020860 [Trypanosoma cruzi]|nr:hypothetical protein TcBrA4_0020860 [Trypanosoma cruzi]
MYEGGRCFRTSGNLNAHGTSRKPLAGARPWTERMGVSAPTKGQRDAVRDGEADPPCGCSAWQTCAQYALCVVLDDWGRVAARHCGAVCVVCGGGMAAIVREVADTELLDWEEVAYVVARWEGPTIPRPALEGRVLK